jgi:hypothetical protein
MQLSTVAQHIIVRACLHLSSVCFVLITGVGVDARTAAAIGDLREQETETREQQRGAYVGAAGDSVCNSPADHNSITAPEMICCTSR